MIRSISTKMHKNESSSSQNATAVSSSGHAIHRSGSVAKMLAMPVATLRVWERRYRLTQQEAAARTQRLYTDADIQRLLLIKQLTDLGHAIGSIAQLDIQQLKHVSATHAQTCATARGETRPLHRVAAAPRAWRLAVIGPALGARLQRPALLRRLGRPVVLLGPFDDPGHAASVLEESHADALLFHEPQLHAGWLGEVNAAAPDLSHLPKAVFYSFASDAVCETLATDGVALLREPQPDAVFAQWLFSLSAGGAKAAQFTSGQPLLEIEPIPPRRWDTAALSDFASMSPTVACECPRHVAELLIQLSHFEAYSAECEHRNEADAEIHAYLKAVAAESRVRFEAALEYVALHEGLLLPRSSSVKGAAISASARHPGAAGRMRSEPPTDISATAAEVGEQSADKTLN